MEKNQFSFDEYDCYYNFDSKNCDEDDDLKTKVYYINQNNKCVKEEDLENPDFFKNKYDEFQKQVVSNDISNNENYLSSNVSTGDVTEKKNNLIFEEKTELQNKNVFKVETLKLKGRKKKSKDNDLKINLTEVIINKNKQIQKVHSKIDKDNLIRKIRIYLIKFAKDLLNNCIKLDFGKNTRRKIKEIVQELTSDITISFNIEFFNSTLERIFSNPLNEKYKKMDKNHNINEIKKIRENINKASLINELLNKKLIEVYNWFIEQGNYEYFYNRYGKDENTHNLSEFLNILKKNEGDDYIQLLKQKGMNFMQFFTDTKARKVQKKRKIKFKGTNFEGYY